MIQEKRVIENKIRGVSSILALPIYARIQALSDAEINEFKKEKIAELEQKIEEESALMESMFQSGKSTEFFKNNIENLKQEIEKVEKKTSQEVKKELSSKIPNREGYDFSSLMNFSPQDYLSNQFYAEIAGDVTKIEQSARLAAEYNKISDYLPKNQEDLMLDLTNLPDELQQRLERSHALDINGCVRNPNKLIEIVEEFEHDFKNEKEKFANQISEQKLSELAEKEMTKEFSFDRENNLEYDTKEGTEANIPFFQQHSDKIQSSELKYLETIIARRDKLSKKIFKTKRVKKEIEKLNVTIKKEQFFLHNKIIDWYQQPSNIGKYYTILGSSKRLNFKNASTLYASIDQNREDIKHTEENISSLKNRIGEISKKIEQHNQEQEKLKQDNNKKRQAIKENFVRIFGEKFSEIDPRFLFDNISGAKKQAAIAARGINTAKDIQQIKNSIQSEARENALNGATIEELQELKKYLLGSEASAITFKNTEFHPKKH